MTIKTPEELEKMKAAGYAVAYTLNEMIKYAQPGISTKQLDDKGREILLDLGAVPAPYAMYRFPGTTCISVNDEAAHGIPNSKRIIQEGDLVNVDVSASLKGFYSDNGCSFVVGKGSEVKHKLCEVSRKALHQALKVARDGVMINEAGRAIEQVARQHGFRIIHDLVGHGIGRKLHEFPHEIPSYYDRSLKGTFKKGMVVAIETFISTKAEHIRDTEDGWTLKTPDGSLVAQHEHTLMITEKEPVIFTSANGI